jgi:hypothetical protein
MSKCLIAGSIRKSVVSSAVLGSLASAMLLHAAGPAAARTCQERYNGCQARCFYKPDDQISTCIQRTCIHQERACEAAERNSPSGGGKGKKPDKVVRDHRGKR